MMIKKREGRKWFTGSEVACIAWLVRGYSKHELAAELNISQRTTLFHFKNIECVLTSQEGVAS
jgi:DNA-binding CsgD family transcriptional regulator